MSKRSPILGYNHNIRHRGLVFHVQTEDSGVDNPHVFTHLFHGGVIIFTRRLDYDADADEAVVKSLMQAQHKAVLKDLKRGEFGDKIDDYLGSDPELEPRRVRDTIPAGSMEEVASRVIEQVENDAGDTFSELVAVPGEVPSIPPISATLGEATVEGDWPPPPSKVSNSEISDVFRVIMQPPPEDDDGEEDVDLWEANIEEVSVDAATEPRRRADTDVTNIPPVPTTVERRGPYGRMPARDTVEMSEPPAELGHSARARPVVGGTTIRRHGQVPPPPPPQRTPRGADGHVGPLGSNSVLVSRPPIRVDSHPSSARSTSAGRRSMAPRTVREDSHDSLFDQQTISEKSLDEVILAYLSEDAAKEKG